MSYVSLWIPDIPTDAACGPELEAALLEVVPRVAVEARGVVWADARGLDGARTAAALLERVEAVVGEGADAGRGGLPDGGRADLDAGGSAAPTVGRAGRGAGADAHPCVGAGVAGVPVAARAAAVLAVRRARGGGEGTGTSVPDASDLPAAPVLEAGGAALVVERGREREFLAPLPLDLLEPARRIAALLDGVGIRTCGELAVLTREAVEVRFGPEGARLRRLARADDPYGTLSIAAGRSRSRKGRASARRGAGRGSTGPRGRTRRGPVPLFGPVPRERPRASLDFVDYVITDPERLVFTANALLGQVCDAVRSRGESARRMALVLDLANGEAWERVIRPARPTANRETWLRLVRAHLERLTVPDAVAGMRVEARAVEPVAVRQGDLFDPGFATAGAVEAALARIIEERGAVVVEPEANAHPLAERRTEWVERGVEAVETGPAEMVPAGRDTSVDEPDGDRPPSGHRSKTGENFDATWSPERPGGPRLTLHLLPEPRPVRVETERRRDHEAPTRFRDGPRWRRITDAAGPDRVSGGQWEEESYAREYFRCVTDGGALVWLYRDAREGAWYLHGWWD